MIPFEKELASWCIKFRWPIVIASLVVTIIFACGLSRITFTMDKRVFLSKENPQLQALEVFEDTYTKDESIVFAVAPEDGDVFTRRTLTMLSELTAACWRIPYSSRVESLVNFQYSSGKDNDLIVRDFVPNPEQLTDKELQTIRKVALSDPILVNYLISTSGHVTGVIVRIIKPEKSAAETSIIASYVSSLTEEFQQKYPDIDLHLTGSIMIDAALAEATRRDLETLLPITLIVLFATLGLCLQSAAGIFGILFVVVASVVMGMGAAGWLGIEISPASVQAPGIILTLGIADSVHILVSLFQQMRQGKGKHESIAEAMRINYQPVILTSVTTAIGFLTMNFSDAPPFRDLGNIVSIGVFGAMIFSLFLLPALISILPISVKPKKSIHHRNMDRFANFVIHQQKPIFWTMMALIIICGVGIRNIELNDDFIKYFDDRFAFRRASDFFSENLTGVYRIEYSLSAGASQGIFDPGYLNTVEAFANWYRGQENVVHVWAVTDVFKRLNMNLNGDDPSQYRIPEIRDQVAQLLMLYEMSLPFGLDLNNQISVDRSSTRLTVVLNDVTSRSLIEMDRKAVQWLKTNAPESMQTHGVSLEIIFAHISERNIRSMLGAIFVALLLTSAVIMVSMRSYRIGFVILILNFSPAIMAFGIWGAMVGRVGLAISIVASFTLGIIVDFTTHFIAKYLKAIREYGQSSVGAVRYAFNTVGWALWITTIALMAGLSVLILSGFQVNSDLGFMTVITIFCALILNFLLLPVLLMKVGEGIRTLQSKDKPRRLSEIN